MYKKLPAILIPILLFTLACLTTIPASPQPPSSTILATRKSPPTLPADEDPRLARRPVAGEAFASPPAGETGEGFGCYLVTTDALHIRDAASAVSGKITGHRARGQIIHVTATATDEHGDLWLLSGDGWSKAEFLEPTPCP